ncbi:MAG TPA: YjbH domain-containing protein, partial [Parachlamydiaceae bacterium]|nr:YjbH domain-containing protein [Parachlamydiaceae bacterium]
SMPSARMGSEGEIGAGYAKVPPYRNYNLRLQLLDHLEISGSYRIYRGVDDPILSPMGFGDLSDKGANVKLALFHPEDSQYALPGIAVGLEDFMGTKGFFARYIAFTQVFPKYDLELTLGYGSNRIKGFFGGVNLMPFRKSTRSWLRNLALSAEYDATPYEDPEIERHPKGRVKNSPINWGVKCRFFDHLDLSFSRIRGNRWSFSLSSFYNFGNTKGFLPKIDDPLPYKGPFNMEPLSCNREENIMVQEFRSAFLLQGFDLLEVDLYEDPCRKKTLRFKIDNLRYALEKEVRRRLNYLLVYLVPADIDQVVVIIDEKGVPIHEYRYQMEYLRAFAAEKMCEYELKLLTPLREVSPINKTSSALLYKTRNLINFEVLPKTYSFFGSSKGKFKYALGLHAGFNGFLPYDCYYSVLFGCTFFSNLRDLTGVDRLNPSQLLNVRTDIVRYYQQRGITVDEAYLQKNWNLGRGWFSRISLGHFEEAYGGIGGELLYFPVNAAWAFGVEGALMKKRSYRGVGFTGKVRKLNGFYATRKRFLGSQAFFNLYYDWKNAGVDFKISAGKFLANDVGVRYELTRHFPSGLRVSVWYAHTNGHDRINDKIYYDKGVSFSMPLDIFYTYSDRDRWRYGLSAWLRDVAVSITTGDSLYNLIYEQRNNH